MSVRIFAAAAAALVAATAVPAAAPPFAHVKANTALRPALVGRDLATPPPADMIQPLRIELQPKD